MPDRPYAIDIKPALHNGAPCAGLPLADCGMGSEDDLPQNILMLGG
jgi:hypothetical protein